MTTLNEKLASVLESDGANDFRTKANSVLGSTTDIGFGGPAVADGLIKIGASIAGVGTVTSSYTVQVNYGYYPSSSWTAGYLQNQDNLAEWGLYSKIGGTTHGAISWQGVGTADWFPDYTDPNNANNITKNVNVFTPRYDLESSSGVDLTGLASQTFLDNGVNGVKDSTPTAFDTLGEIASSLPTSENVSAYINLNTGSRLHTIVGDGTTTEFSVTHKSGNVDVFLDGVLQIPQLGDSTSGATSVISEYEYHSMPGLVTLGTGDTYTSLYSDQRLFTIPAFPDLWDWLIAQGAPVWGAPWSGTPALTFEYNGATETYTGLTWVLYDTYSGAAPWVGHMLSYQNGGLNGFLPQGGATNVTVKGDATSPSSTSGESCPKIVFSLAPGTGQVITVKTY
jgi:spore coat protein U-like protein